MFKVINNIEITQQRALMGQGYIWGRKRRCFGEGRPSVVGAWSPGEPAIFSKGTMGPHWET